MRQDDFLGLSASGGRAHLQRTETLGLPADATPDLGSIVALSRSRLASGTPLLVTFVNPHSRDVARRTPQVRQDLESFDCVLPDGIGMSLAIRWLNRIPAARVSFDMTSLAPAILTLAAQERRRVVLVGGVPGCAERAAARLQDVFPGLDIVGIFDGYGEKYHTTRSERTTAGTR